DERLWDHVQLRRPRVSRRPMEDRGVHPRPAVEPGSDDERRAARGTPAVTGADAMNSNQALKLQLDRLQQRALGVGGMALALAFAGAIAKPAQFFRAYLLAYVFWIGFPLGSMALLMLHHLAGGYWGFVIRRSLEAGTRSFQVMALLFLPVLAGLRFGLFPWAQADGASDPMWRQKHFSLTVPFFVARAVVYFAAWI